MKAVLVALWLIDAILLSIIFIVRTDWTRPLLITKTLVLALWVIAIIAAAIVLTVLN